MLFNEPHVIESDALIESLCLVLVVSGGILIIEAVLMGEWQGTSLVVLVIVRVVVVCVVATASAAASSSAVLIVGLALFIKNPG